MKEKIKKTILLIIFILIGIGVGIGIWQYQNYQKFVREQNEKEFLFSMKQECSKIGKSAYEEWSSQWNSPLPAIYTYNKELGTCLISTGASYSWGGDTAWEKIVMDSYTNEIIIALYYTPNTDQEVHAKNYEEFWARHKQLFLETN